MEAPRPATRIPVKALATLTWPLCAADVGLTTLFFLLCSGSPPFSDFNEFWQQQVVHYSYYRCVADAFLLSWFRAAPGVFSFRKISQAAIETPAVAKASVWTAGFMVFKTGLSFLAVFSKSSYFKSWDSTWMATTLIFTVSCALLELLLSIFIFVGLRRIARSEGEGSKSSGGENGLAEPLLGKDLEEGSSPAAEDKKAKKGKSPSVYRLLQLAKPERPLILMGTLALFLSSAATMALPYFIGRLIDDVQIEINEGTTSAADAKHRLSSSTLELLGILLLGSVFTFVRGTLFNMAGERLVARVRRDLFSKIITMEIAFFDSSKTGELMNRLSSDTTMIQNACTSNTSMFLRFFLQVIFSTILLFFTSWKLTLVMFAVIPALVIITRIYSGLTRKLSKRYQDALASSSDVAQEALSNIRTVRSFAAEGVESGKYDGKVNESYRLGVKKAVAYGAFTGGVGAFAYCAMLLVLWYGGIQVIEGKLTAGTLTSFLLYTVYIATGLSVISGLISEWMQAVGASERMFELFDRVNDVGVTGGTPATSIQGEVVFKEVGFHYPAREDVQVLNNFDLTIAPNTTVALVGHSGAGKSTILALLQRYYDVSSGQVLVDGVDLRTYDMTSLRRHMAVVSQEPVLFGSTIRENICYGLLAQHEPMPSQERIEEVARIANCHDFITRFPEGYDTVVGERGIRLSGGQKQRICIARALLANPRILLLDEATSALDSQSEHLVREAIDRLMVGRTVIIIAHRLSTVRDATMIVVMSDGTISGLGTHAELLERNEIYRQLVKYQLQSENGNPVGDE